MKSIKPNFILITVYPLQPFILYNRLSSITVSFVITQFFLFFPLFSMACLSKAVWWKMITITQGTNLLVSFGMKFGIMFNKVSVNVLTCQLGSVLKLRYCRQGNAPFNSSWVCSINIQYFSLNGRGGGILKLTLQWTIWWWQ